MQCPYCGKDKIRYGSTLLRHCLRRLFRSGKRYCLSCGKKWCVGPAGVAFSDLFFNRISALVALSIFITFLVVTLMGGSFDPGHFFKRAVRSHYDQKYGADSRNKLWADFGALYGTKDNAGAEYQNHSKQ